MTCEQCLYKSMCAFCLTNEEAERCKHFADKGEYVRVGKYKKKHPTNSTKKTVGQILFEKRRSRGWTQNKIAEKIDVCTTTYASWEIGKAYPNALYLSSLADVFNCTIDELCGREVKSNE